MRTLPTRQALSRFASLVMRSHSQTTFSDTETEIGEAVDFVAHLERNRKATHSEIVVTQW